MRSDPLSSRLLFAALISFPSALACLQNRQHVATAQNIAEQVERRSSTAPSTKTVIENVRVFDGRSFTDPRSVVFENGIIVADNENIETKVNGTGKFLIPGLMDAHLHIPDVTGLEAATSYGVTTAFNMVCRDYTYAACTALRNMSGTGLTSLLSAGVAAVGPPNSNSSLNPPADQIVYPNTDVVQLVDRAVGNSSDYYKLVAGAGGLTQKQHNIIVARAHELDLQTMTHASDLASYLQAVNSRTDGIQHIPDDGLITACMMRDMKKHKQFATPTMSIFKYGFSNPLVLQFLGKANSPNATYAHVEANVKRLHGAGVPIIAGTDAVGAIAPGLDLPFGLTLHQELELLHGAGLSPLEALRAATVETARQHRLSDRGVIEIGKRADLVLLNSNPLLNISNTRDLERVWVGGVEFLGVAKLTG